MSWPDAEPIDCSAAVTLRPSSKNFGALPVLHPMQAHQQLHNARNVCHQNSIFKRADTGFKIGVPVVDVVA